MRTITYERVLQKICGLIGIVRADLQTDEEALLRQHYNRAARHIWDHTAWPFLCTIEERTPVAGLISFTQTDETVIDTVFAVYDYDPHGTTAARALPYTLTSTGIQLTDDRLTSTDNVWVWFRQRCPDFDGDAYAAATAYVTDGQVYYATTGDFYRAKQASTGNLPTVTTHWERLQLPYDFADYVVHCTYADWLRSEGQDEKAAIQAGSTADRILADAIDKVERQQGIQPPMFVNTHLSTQST